MGNVYRSKGHEETIRMLDQWEWEAKVRKELERVFAQEEADDNELQGVWTPEQLFNEFGYSFSQNFLHGLIDLVNSSSINDLEDKIPNYVYSFNFNSLKPKSGVPLSLDLMYFGVIVNNEVVYYPGFLERIDPGSFNTVINPGIGEFTGEGGEVIRLENDKIWLTIQLRVAPLP